MLTNFLPLNIWSGNTFYWTQSEAPIFDGCRLPISISTCDISVQEIATLAESMQLKRIFYVLLFPTSLEASLIFLPTERSFHSLPLYHQGVKRTEAHQVNNYTWLIDCSVWEVPSCPQFFNSLIPVIPSSLSHMQIKNTLIFQLCHNNQTGQPPVTDPFDATPLLQC